jgi:hypothetical protein
MALFLILSWLFALLSICVFPVCYIVDYSYYSNQENPPKTWKDSGDGGTGDDPPSRVEFDVDNMAVDYHGIAKYIEELKIRCPPTNAPE